MANAVQKKRHLGIFDEVRTRDEVLKEIHGNPVTRNAFFNLSKEFQERFVEFCMGVRGVKMTYNPFFKKIFNAEIYPERLSRFLTEILGASPGSKEDASKRTSENHGHGISYDFGCPGRICNRRACRCRNPENRLPVPGTESILLFLGYGNAAVRACEEHKRR